MQILKLSQQESLCQQHTVLSLMSHLRSGTFAPHSKETLQAGCTQHKVSTTVIYRVAHAIDSQDQHSARQSTNMLLRPDETLPQVALTQGWMGEPLLQPGAC